MRDHGMESNKRETDKFEMKRETTDAKSKGKGRMRS